MYRVNLSRILKRLKIQKFERILAFDQVQLEFKGSAGLVRFQNNMICVK